MASILSYTHAGATLVAELRNEGTGVGPGPFLLIHGIGMGRSVFTDLISHLDDAAPSSPSTCRDTAKRHRPSGS